MGSEDNQQFYAPYQGKDCAQGFCSLYCPQWCYAVFPPPPPIEFSGQGRSPNFSPLVIAIIGMLGSAFLLISYYLLASKYCGDSNSSRGMRPHRDIEEESDDAINPLRQEEWQMAGSGLDEALIRCITVCRYKRGDGLVEGTDCSVCLSEFQEDENLRLLPKCSHAFHPHCIDVWLKSHSNCPLCRAAVVPATALPSQFCLPVAGMVPDHTPSRESQRQSNPVSEAAHSETCAEEASFLIHGTVSKPSRDEDTVFEIRCEGVKSVTRSLSLDPISNGNCFSDLSCSGVHSQQIDERGCSSPMNFNSSRQQRGESSKPTCQSRALHSVMNPTPMKRSSSGRLLRRPGKEGILDTNLRFYLEDGRDR